MLIQSLNVKRLGKSIKRHSLFRWFHNQKHQFAFLHETHSTKECAQLWEAEWVGKVFNCTLMEMDKKGGNSTFKKARIIQDIERLMNLYDLSGVVATQILNNLR